MRTKLFLAWGLGLAAALSVGAGALSAQTSTRDKYEERVRKESAFNLGAESDFTLNVNNWLCGITNDGEICVNTFGSTTGGGGFWPIGTRNQYVFMAGLQMAARDPLNPNAFVAAHCFNVSATNAGCRPLSNIYHSDDAADLAAWPETCNIWNPQTGEYVKALSQLDTCVRYWDGDPAATVPGGHPMGVEVVQHTLAFTLEGFRDMIFFIFKIKNISHTALFKQANPSLNVPADGWKIEDMYLAFGHDADVSDAYDNNFGTFVPYLRAGADTVPLFLGTIWVADFEAAEFDPYPQCGFCSNPGFVGTTFLKSPYNNTGDTIRTNITGVRRVIPPIAQERLEELRLAAAKGDTIAQAELRKHEIGQSFGSLTTRGGVFPDPTDAAQSWRYYSGNLNQAERAQVSTAPPGFGFVDQPTPADTRYFHATGPFDIAPGDSVEVVVGMVPGAPVLDVPGFTPGNLVPHGLPGDTSRMVENIMGRGRTETAYPSIFKQVLNARALFETNFLLPSPPPAPTVTAIPGDHEVALTWSADPVEARDPFAQIAERFGIENFREQDFEGFRVYRKVRPNADWELIAQFDQRNGITTQIVTTDSVLTADSTWLAVRADTAVGGTDTGLQFGLIDRGGRFPDPSNGPGLVNGVTYYYTVTAYDINTPFAPGGSSLESGQRLASTSQAIGGAAATPRSTAAGRIAAKVSAPMLLGAGDTPLNPARELEIDDATGIFTTTPPAANGLELGLTLFDEQLVKAGDFAVTVDSVVPLNGYEFALGQYEQHNPNCLGVSTLYFMTLTTPNGSRQIQQEVQDPFGLFGCVSEVNNEFLAESFKADPQAAQQVGRSGDHFAGTFTARLNYGPTHLLSGAEAVATFRSHVTHEEGGSRWFPAGEPVPEPTLGTDAGSLPGVTKIWNVASQYVQHDYMRWPGVYLMAPLMREAEFEVTWGQNGTVESVMDLTHNLELPFSDRYRASWGIITEGTGDGVLGFSDVYRVSPTSEWWYEEPGFHVPMVRQATILPASTVPPLGSGPRRQTANTQGFMMHIAGELYLFETSQLPAPGTKWRLVTYSGEVHKDEDTGEYLFDPTAKRPPNIAGLTAQISIESATQFDLASASLERVHTVPDPFIVSSPLQTGSADRRIQFVNLPTQATIRIFSLAGVLVDALEHDDPSGGGTAEWDLRNRNQQYVASGVYFYHVSTPDGKTKIGKFTVIQAPGI